LQIIDSDIDIWVTTAQIRLDATLQQELVMEALDLVLANKAGEHNKISASHQVILDQLESLNAERGSVNFRDFFVLSSSGEIVLSTQPAWKGKHLTGSHFHSLFSNVPGTFIDHAVPPLSNEEIMIFSHVPIEGAGEINGYLIGILNNSQFLDFLTFTAKFLPQSNSYIVLENGSFLGLDYHIEELAVLSPSRSQVNTLIHLNDQHLLDKTGEQANLYMRSFDGTQSIAGYRWLESLGAGLTIDVPQVIAFEKLKALTPFALISPVVLIALLSIILWIISTWITRPIITLTKTTRQFAMGNWEKRVEEIRDDEIGVLSHTFNHMAEELTKLYKSLSAQVAEQTIELHNRSTQLEATAQVAHEASSIRDLDVLLRDTTEMISNKFGFYHVGIFLVDEENEFAILQAANSEGGQRMLMRGHRLGVGQRGVVGHAAKTGLPRIALDVGEDDHFFNNSDLPETRSEIALPLRSQDRVIGVLDVQSKTPEAFSNQEVEVLQIMADQIAMAIDNVRLLDQSQQTVQELQLLYGQHIDKAWQQRLGSKEESYHFDQVRVKTATQDQISVFQTSDQNQVKVHTDDLGYQHLLIPIILRGQSLGDIALRRNPDEAEWTLDDRELAEEVSTQIAVALENARLLEESQRRAAQEELLSQATARFSQSLDIDTVLQMAVRELGQLAGVTEVSVQITPEQ